MTVKTFTFPSFEEWNKTLEYRQTIGAYTCAIELFAWGCKENIKNEYVAAFSDFSIPTATYVRHIFHSSITCDRSDIETLKDWYKKVTIQINDKWKDFILDSYFYK